MRSLGTSKPLSYLWDVFAFSASLAMAYVLKWEVKDLVWSLWLSSLVVGFLIIVATIVGGAWHSERTDGEGLTRSLFQGALMLVFFTIHFGGFHLGHGAFLQSFFPLSENRGGLGFIFEQIFTTVIPAYGVFLIPAFIASREVLMKPFLVRPVMGKRNKSSDLSAPYKSVIKMHLLIFFFAGCAKFNLEHFLVYAVVYALFFFPWRILSLKKGVTNA